MSIPSRYPSNEFRRDLNGRPVYRVEETYGRRTVLSPEGRRLGYMEQGRTYDTNGHLIGNHESEAIIVAHAGIKFGR